MGRRDDDNDAPLPPPAADAKALATSSPELVAAELARSNAGAPRPASNAKNFIRRTSSFEVNCNAASSRFLRASAAAAAMMAAVAAVFEILGVIVEEECDDDDDSAVAMVVVELFDEMGGSGMSGSDADADDDDDAAAAAPAGAGAAIADDAKAGEEAGNVNVDSGILLD
jgi:hypothetical protein